LICGRQNVARAATVSEIFNDEKTHPSLFVALLVLAGCGLSAGYVLAPVA
jgi:hypothetical protein